jgi:hypothetical protein
MEYRNAKYINDNGWIDCEINHSEYGWIPYTLDPNDTDMTINNNDLLAAMNANGDVAAYVPPTAAEIDAKLAATIRRERNAILETEVDPIVSNPLRWADMTEAKQTEWTNYRTALLDITTQASFPTSVTWPTKPT